MRSSKIRSRISSGQTARIACMYYPTAMMPSHAAQAGYDGIWLDAEHNTWDKRELQRMIQLHHHADIDCIVRTGDRSPTALYHLLESGATALMIPLVNTAAEARALAQSVKFPPAGQRGLDGAGLDNDFYLNGTDRYPAMANRETLLIVQIETPEAIRNVHEIAAVSGVDGMFIGPGDLSLRYGCPMDWSNSFMADAQARVAEAAAAHTVAWGRPARDAADIRQLRDLGAQLIAHGSDFSSVARGLATAGSALQAELDAPAPSAPTHADHV